MNKNTIREYRQWKAMKSRCYSPSNKDLSYQQNNIQVCERWKNSYENFYEDMGDCPKGYSLDRIDNNNDYTPENCRWASQKEQCSNRGSFNLLYTFKGETKILKDWAKHFDIKYTTLYTRIFRSGMSFEKAIQNKNYNIRKLTFKDQTFSLKEWSEKTGISYTVITDRLSRGWSIERIFTQPVRKSPTK